MIIEVTKVNYKGFTIVYVEQQGWKIILEEEYLFPNLQAAQSAVNTFLREVIPDHKGKKIKHST